MKSASNRTKYFLAVISLGFVYGSMFNLAYMKYIFYDAMLEAMQCTNTQLGLLITVYTIVSCVGLLPGGWIADRCKTKGIIVVSAYLQAAVSIFFAFTMRSYACAMITWIISGIASVTAFFAAILMAMRWSCCGSTVPPVSIFRPVTVRPLACTSTSPPRERFSARKGPSRSGDRICRYRRSHAP